MLMEYAMLQEELSETIAEHMEVESTKNRLNLRWNHKAPIVRANQLAEKLGTPDRYSQEAGGVAIWYYVDPYFRSKNLYSLEDGERIKPSNVYSKLMIKDEEIPHIVPAPHNDFYYAYVYMDIPEDRVQKVRELTESVGYDTMKREVYARCHFAPANLTSLYLIKQIANGHKNLLHAQQEYVTLIPTLAKEEKKGKGLMQTPGKWHQTLTNYLFDLLE
jgi:hypothetical protein